jgi:hypothetical protein
MIKLLDLLKEDDIVKNKKTGNIYIVKQMDPNKHEKPSPAEVEKAKAKSGGVLPKVGQTPTSLQPQSNPQSTDKKKSANGEEPNPKSGESQQSETPPPGKLSGKDFVSKAEKNIAKDKQSIKKDNVSTKLKDLMPNATFDRKPLSAIEPVERQQISTIIDKLADLGKQAKEKGEKAPNFNLCQVSVPGTNLYCDGNKGIPREDMPQFKGTPEPGSPADKLPKDKNGEADTEEFFKQMLEKQGIKVSKPYAVPADRLKATQSELVGVKVAGMEKALEENPQHPAITAPIYVSNDGYVLDGHHRWAAIVAYNASHIDKPIPMNVRVIDEPIVPLVHRSNKFAETIGIKAKAADTSAK